ncbi:MAG: DUF262 domain-containing protein [Prevotella sp.]|nr:DUF262 domain-containing protein [Prevotella sp.]
MEAINIQSLFSTASQFVIPSYQRAYSWGTNQREQFIEDLRDAVDRYYLGHFLFEKADGSDSVCLIDGQQRLTTIVIFFSCMQKELERRSVSGDDIEMTAKRLHHTYIRDSFTKKRRFKTVDYDDAFFLNEIIDRSTFVPEEELTSSSQKRIRHCREYFEKVFEGEEVSTLLKWTNLIEQASVTEFKVGSKIEAAQIFAFQNDRGKSLSHLEVLKSFFMLQIYLHEAQETQEDYILRLNKAFEDIYEAIVRISTNEDDVLRYFWMAYSTKGYFTEKPLEEIKGYFKNKSIEDLIGFVDKLARSYRQVEFIEKDKSFDMMNLKRLNNMALTLPLLIKAKVIANTTEQTYSRLIRLAENFTFRQAARGGRAAIESRLHGLLVNSWDDVSFNQQMNNFVDRMRWDYWNDNELRRVLSSGFIYGNRKVCTYLLWRYEQSLCPQDYPAPRLNWEDIVRKESLEHIAPQHPQDGKPLASGYGEYKNLEYPEEGIETGEWLHSIGNLLLMSQSQNSAVGNKDFISVKLPSYESETSMLRQQKEIRDFVDNPATPCWNKSAIERRCNHIIEQALKMWNIDKI